MAANSLIQRLDYYVAQGRPQRVNPDPQGHFPTEHLPISPELTHRFNIAIGLAGQGKTDEALQAFEKIFEGTDQAHVASAEFIALVEIQRAYCLMNKGRYEDAKRVFASEKLVFPVNTTQLTAQDTFYYFFSYGNTLAALRDKDGMEWQLSRALWFAAVELGDAQLSSQAWQSLISKAEYLQEWALMLKTSIEAGEFAASISSSGLFYHAAVGRAKAYQALGNYEEATRWGRYMIELYKQAEQQDIVQMWQEFIQSLPG